MILATGFVLRIYYGASLLNIEVSSWLFLTVLSFALFLGLGKRKKECQFNTNVRKALEKYSVEFLDKIQYVTLTLSLTFYSLWTIEQNIKLLNFMIPILIVIFMRYSLIIEIQDEGDPITILYSDKMLMGLCFIYVMLMLLILIVL